MNRQQGFTLIELIMVVVLLGILAVFAVPRFVGLQADAQQASLNGILGAVRSSASIAHAQFLIAGSAPESVDMAGHSIRLVHGYPAASHIHVAASMGLTALNTGDSVVIDGVSISLSADGVTRFRIGNCEFQYQQASSVNRPPLIGELICSTN